MLFFLFLFTLKNALDIHCDLNLLDTNYDISGNRKSMITKLLISEHILCEKPFLMYFVSTS